MIRATKKTKVFVNLWECASFQSFFGFGQSADIDIVLDGHDTRRTAEIKTEDGRKERHYLYYDGESVSGKVSFSCLWHHYSRTQLGSVPSCKRSKCHIRTLCRI